MITGAIASLGKVSLESLIPGCPFLVEDLTSSECSCHGIPSQLIARHLLNLFDQLMKNESWQNFTDSMTPNSSGDGIRFQINAEVTLIFSDKSIHHATRKPSLPVETQSSISPPSTSSPTKPAPLYTEVICRPPLIDPQR